MISALSNGLRVIGFDFGRFQHTLGAIPRYWRDVRHYRSLADRRFPLRLRHLRPMLLDYTDQAGIADRHYFYQDLWASRLIFTVRPTQHFDIGSRIDGFIAHVLSFMPVCVLDIRPLPMDVPGLTFMQTDATNLSMFADASIGSLSCLHAVEHFGLGRYADPIDPDACFAAMGAMQRVLQPGGRLYLSMPVGRERLEFNAHRIFDPQTILATFDRLQLVNFAAVDDNGIFHPHDDPGRYTDARYACGMFEFTKPARTDGSIPSGDTLAS